MAVPRVFVSSTYYDLKPYRSNIENFITGLGYEPIMHERSGVAYTQTQPLEADCYRELETCEIVVCIIGNHFGSKASESDLSVTMEELKTAIRNRKKIYVFVSNDVYIENKTYKLNKDNGNFKSAYTDNVKIHEFIAELLDSTKIHVIMPFDTTEQIIGVLKGQFAGLFQNLLAREAAITEAKTAYDLQETAENVKSLVAEFRLEKEEFFDKFDCTLLVNNPTLTAIKKYLGLDKSAFFANDFDSLKEIMTLAGYIFDPDSVNDNLYRFEKSTIQDGNKTTKTITLHPALFDEKMRLIPVRSKRLCEEYIKYDEKPELIDEIPF
jgi:hypothetical protein